MGMITAGAIDGVDLLAGIASSAGRKAEDSGDFDETSSIAGLRIKGYRTAKGQTPPRFMIDSNVSAASLGKSLVTNLDASTITFNVLGGETTGIERLQGKDTVDKSLNFVYPTVDKDNNVVTAPQFIRIL